MTDLRSRRFGQGRDWIAAWLDRLTSIAIATAAVMVAIGFARKTVFTAAVPAAATELHVTEDEWKTLLTNGHQLGSSGGPVTMVVFSDFQCPACRVFAERVRIVQRDFPTLSVLFRHAPLPIHPQAMEAAVASECAADQGRFPAFHDAAFSQQEAFGSIEWSVIAEAAQVGDMETFKQCLELGDDAAIVRDRKAAEDFGGISGTPIFFVNGSGFHGAPPLQALRDLVERAAGRVMEDD